MGLGLPLTVGRVLTMAMPGSVDQSRSSVYWPSSWMAVWALAVNTRPTSPLCSAEAWVVGSVNTLKVNPSRWGRPFCQ